MLIKPCPHCGGPGYLNSNYSNKCRLYFVMVKCDICGSQGKLYKSNGNPSEEDWDSQPCRDAITAWNMRTDERREDEWNL